MKCIAIIGSGPAGCYLADQLLRPMPDASIDVLERLPVPFGLVRYGVAPDHQRTKAVARVLDRVLSRDRVSFFGNVEVGCDVHLEELMSLYDAVVLATGASRDRQLGIPGEDLPGVVGSAAFTGWYNGHPDVPTPFLDEVRSPVIIGNGNVAIDVARMLAKKGAEFAGSDLTPEATSLLGAQPIETIHVVGRRNAADAKFTDPELAELGALARAQPTVATPAGLTGTGPVVERLRSFAFAAWQGKPVRIDFHFNLTPSAFLGDGRLRAVRFRQADGRTCELPAQLAITCIGYEARSCCSATPSKGVFANEAGRLADRLYVAGWAERGPSGTIPTNRAEAQQLAQKIAREVTDRNRAGRLGLQKLLNERGSHRVDYSGWRRIEAAELGAAAEERCRLKFCRREEMLLAAQADKFPPVVKLARC